MNIRAIVILTVITTLVASVAHADDVRKFEVYGFAQGDYIQDFNRVNPDWEATLRPSKIPTIDGLYGSDGQAILSVRQSRLGVQANLPTDAGAVYTKLEFDFFGVGADAGQTTIRLRHAYGSWRNWLAGQTNSLFMDVDIFPNTIDYWGPCGMVFLRNPQIRFTHVAGEKSFAVAIENPSNDIDVGEIRNLDPALGASIQSQTRLPDLTAQLRVNTGWGHFQIAGILRKIGYETLGGPNSTPKGSTVGGGVDVTANVAVGEKDMVKLGVVGGEGIANYMNDGGTDLAPDGPVTNIEAAAVPLLGVSAYYDHYWNDRFSSSLGYAVTTVDNTSLQTADAFRSGQYASGNLLYYPTKNVFLGGEFLWGRREDNGGAHGEDIRVQFSFHYGFSSTDFLQL